MAASQINRKRIKKNFRYWYAHFSHYLASQTNPIYTHAQASLATTTIYIYIAAYHSDEKGNERKKGNGKFNNKPHKLNLCFFFGEYCVYNDFISFRFIVFTKTEIRDGNEIHWNGCFNDDFRTYLEWRDINYINLPKILDTCAHICRWFLLAVWNGEKHRIEMKVGLIQSTSGSKIRISS